MHACIHSIIQPVSLSFRQSVSLSVQWFVITPLPKQFIWESDSSNKLKNALRSPDLNIPIRECFPDEDTLSHEVNTALGNVGNILISAAKRSLKIRNTKNTYAHEIFKQKMV